MPSSLQVLAALMGTALALPSSPITSADPVRILPCSWNFTISALKGPGCPDFADVSQTFTTRPTFGMNTVDGSEIYYWHFAYPYIHLSVGAEKPEASTWCETTLAYTEQQDCGPDPAVDPAYRLKLHKNGTRMLALYELDEGVEAKWKFTYATDGDDTIVDAITVAGPREAGSYIDTSVQSKLVQWPLPKCGSGAIKYRTELTLKATKPGAEGSVSSETRQLEGGTQYYGVQQGISYDWEKCAA